MFIYNSCVLDFFLYKWRRFFTVNPCLTQFFSQAGLASHRQASPHPGGPHLTQADPTQGGLPSHREAFPHTERPHLTQGGLPSHREAPPHTGRPPLTSRRQTSCRHAFPHRKASPHTGKLYTGIPRLACLFQKEKQTNELREENPKPLGV